MHVARSVPIAVLVLALTGCAPEDDAMPLASPLATTPAAGAEASTPPADPCLDAPALTPVSDDVDDRLGNYAAVMVLDSGERAGARGTTTLTDAGEPAAYVVASDDHIEDIAERFCTTTSWIQMLNSVRRDSRFSDTTFGLFAGDTLNLDPYTIRSVGDENSSVRTHEPIIHIPPQR